MSPTGSAAPTAAKGSTKAGSVATAPPTSDELMLVDATPHTSICALLISTLPINACVCRPRCERDAIAGSPISSYACIRAAVRRRHLHVGQRICALALKLIDHNFKPWRTSTRRRERAAVRDAATAVAAVAMLLVRSVCRSLAYAILSSQPPSSIPTGFAAAAPSFSYRRLMIDRCNTDDSRVSAALYDLLARVRYACVREASSLRPPTPSSSASAPGAALRGHAGQTAHATDTDLAAPAMRRHRRVAAAYGDDPQRIFERFFFVCVVCGRV